MTWPSWSTRMEFASTMVERRWATMREVRFSHKVANADWILRSVFVSKADVASSRIIILGFLRNKRAIAILCFSPPLNFSPVLQKQLNKLFFHPKLYKYIIRGSELLFWCGKISFITNNLDGVIYTATRNSFMDIKYSGGNWAKTLV